MEKNLDRRVIRSQSMLRNALIHEIDEKGYDAVSVNDIVRRADLNRSTFYAHYKDKQDLLHQTFQAILAELNEKLKEFANPKDTLPTTEEVKHYTQLVFEHIAEHHDFYRVMLLKKGDLEFISELEHHLELMIFQRFSQFTFIERDLEIPMSLLIAYSHSAFIGIIKWWLGAGSMYTPAFVVKKVEQLMLENFLNFGETFPHK